MLSSTMETLERRLLQWQATSSRWPSTSTSPRTQYRRQSSETKRADERKWTRWPSYLEVFKTKKLKAVHCSRLTLRIFLLLFPLPWVDDHPSLEALQETWRLLSLLDLNLKKPQKNKRCQSNHTPIKWNCRLRKAGNKFLFHANLVFQTLLLYLCSTLFIQLHRHECWCSFLADGGVAALPEEVAALFLPRSCRLQLLRVLSLPNCKGDIHLRSVSAHGHKTMIHEHTCCSSVS